MHVTELFDLTWWINEHIKEPEIVSKYQNLLSILHNNTQPNQQQQPFEEQAAELTGALRQITFETLTKDQLLALDQLDISESIGGDAADFIDHLLYERGADIATAHSQIKTRMKKLATGIAQSDELQNRLGVFELPEPALASEVLTPMLQKQSDWSGEEIRRDGRHCWYCLSCNT